ncbi:uncharacterized protein LY79DRAFT_20017 [Colletotrichum navitas]|uniref:Uncharacterized protein n=1 Tax=Colletotrichum navitas TaxID=681940 RepID=A0AAD8VCV3_9PEZI|nr:uncharacterized protein LY79DRAFT_20017 [Colletotrichum navitas]KAK1600456.1 hypothetical protein LY79DRAFT_20017 [Colletotrichum navitas]
MRTRTHILFTRDFGETGSSDRSMPCRIIKKDATMCKRLRQISSHKVPPRPSSLLGNLPGARTDEKYKQGTEKVLGGQGKIREVGESIWLARRAASRYVEIRTGPRPLKPRRGCHSIRHQPISTPPQPIPAHSPNLSPDPWPKHGSIHRHVARLV